NSISTALLAELKGFEVKRNGELQLIKIFQSSVFEGLPEGDSLAECYAAGQAWRQGQSIAGPGLPLVISKSGPKALQSPNGPAEPSVKRHFLRRWLKSPAYRIWTFVHSRLGLLYRTVEQRRAEIITIPAALQHVANPVCPACRIPDWLRKKLLEKTDVFKQRRNFRYDDAGDSVLMEIGTGEDAEAAEAGARLQVLNAARTFSNPNQDAIGATNKPPVVNALSRTPGPAASSAVTDLDKPWFEALGEPPRLRRDSSKGFADWLRFHKRKWRHQRAQQRACNAGGGASKRARTAGIPPILPPASPYRLRIFWRRCRCSLLGLAPVAESAVCPLLFEGINELCSTGPGDCTAAGETGEPGLFRMWIVVDQELRCVKV
uniref:DNA polymerase epsilon catalytic subunit n=1 Tax=Macrostomum lignano TaxID=282301 RepID=A0A1I8F8Q7_9PLAT